MTRLSHTKAEVALLPDRILACLKREPMWSVQELSIKLGFATGGIRKALFCLQDLNLVHHTQARTHGGLGLINYWNYGPKPAGLQLLRSKTLNAQVKRAAKADSDPSDTVDRCPLRQRTVKAWVPNHVRCEFETYLFGPAQREAA